MRTYGLVGQSAWTVSKEARVQILLRSNNNILNKFYYMIVVDMPPITIFLYIFYVRKPISYDFIISILFFSKQLHILNGTTKMQPKILIIFTLQILSRRSGSRSLVLFKENIILYTNIN